MLEPWTRPPPSDEARTKRGLFFGVRAYARLVVSAAVIVGATAVSPAAAAASTVGSIAPEIVRGLGTLPAAAIVVASPLTSDHPSPRGDELSVRIAQLV